VITTMLQGGCCNQLFQFAFGLATAERLGVRLQLDVGLLRNDSMRQYNLGLFRGVTEKLCEGNRTTISECGLPYNQKIVDSIKDGDVLQGYWQSEKYFKLVENLIRYAIVPNQPLTNFGKQTAAKIAGAGPRSTFLTIRRTDYVQKQDFHGVLVMDYYLKALDIINQKVQPYVFVFSDEPDWVRQNFWIPYEWELAGSFDQTTPRHLGREDQDLYLMSLCSNAVMANSSFSWWGAWLGEKKQTVIAPKKWFTTPYEDPRDIYQPDWIQI
jgi:glycosyl transferase family 11